MSDEKKLVSDRRTLKGTVAAVGAAHDFLTSGPNLMAAALADVLPDYFQSCRKTHAEDAKQQIADDRCYGGFDACKKLNDSDVDVILQATPRHSG